jgi:dihydroneopterin aldolase
MTIRIEALTFDAVIGILDFERLQPQKVRVDAIIVYRYDEAFIDYAEAAELIKTVIRDGRFGLLEEALEALRRELKARFALIDSLTLRIAKPEILPDCTVTLEEQYKF